MVVTTNKSRPQMLRILRIKFILLNMLLAALVLVCAFIVVCYADYTARLNAVYAELDLALTNVTASRIPQIAGLQVLTRESGARAIANIKTEDDFSAANTIPQQTPPVDTDTSNTSNASSSTSLESTASTLADDVPNTASSESAASASDDSIIDSSNATILVAVYEVAPDGTYDTILEHTAASFPKSVIVRANEIAVSDNSPRGYLPEFDLYYEQMPSQENPDYRLIAYADGRSVSEWKSLAWPLTFIGVAALAVLFFINIFFSRWALRPVEQSIKQQQQFTADASHELKTPLTVILANMAILRSQPNASVSEQMQWVDSTQTEAERMQLLVNDMLALSKPDQQKVEYATEEVDFTDLVEGEALQFESVAFELGVQLESEIESNLVVIGNHDRLARMTATLIDNACKYASDTDNASVEVTLSKGGSAGRKAEAVLTVHNNGPEIGEEDLPHIFDRFYRADKARTSSKGGYGLGLAIGQEIAHEHNGNITVASAPGEGATFTVTLPLMD